MAEILADPFHGYSEGEQSHDTNETVEESIAVDPKFRNFKVLLFLDRFLFQFFPVALLSFEFIKLNDEVINIIQILNFVQRFETLDQCLLGDVKHEDLQFQGPSHQLDALLLEGFVGENLEIDIPKVNVKNIQALSLVFGQCGLQFRGVFVFWVPIIGENIQNFIGKFQYFLHLQFDPHIHKNGLTLLNDC